MADVCSSHRVLFDENLLTEILVQLTAKNIVKLKSVCIRWYTILSSDPFAQTHALRHPPNSDLTSTVIIRKRCRFRKSTVNHTDFLSLPNGRLSSFTTPFSSSIVKDCCNGLLLFETVDYDGVNCYSVYNPATCQLKMVPTLILPPKFCVSDVYLAFDPSRFEGFCVVCFVSNIQEFCWFDQLYYYRNDSESSSWKKLDELVPHVARDAGVYWNGSIYYVNCVFKDATYFDVVNEKSGTLPLQQIAQRRYHFGQLRVLNGNLHYLDLRSGPAVFALETDNEEMSWIVKYKVDTSSELMIRDGFTVLCFVVCEEEEKKERSLEMVVVKRGKIMSYDLQRNTWRIIFGDDMYDKLPFDWDHACSYNASFALF